jgi:hypothetical protein
MAELSLQEIFGANATQTIDNIIISKADLAAVGLTAAPANTGEAIFMAFALIGQLRLTQVGFDANIDQSLVVETQLPGFIFRGTENLRYRTDQLTITAAKPDEGATIDPDLY